MMTAPALVTSAMEAARTAVAGPRRRELYHWQLMRGVHCGRKLMTMRCRLADAEADALALAEELGADVSLAWLDPAAGDWTAFASYTPRGERLLARTRQWQHRVGGLWLPIKQQEGGAL